MTVLQTTKIGFALEYSLGHTTHARNLKRVLDSGVFGSVEPYYVDLPFDGTPVGAWGKLPLVRNNWSVRASLGAHRGLRPWVSRLDAALFHTQVTALFSAGLMRRVPSVVSLDATPIQIDSLAHVYDQAPAGSGPVESFKKHMNSRAFTAARHLVTWSDWAKNSLISDYGVPEEKVSVIPPGIDAGLWPYNPRRKAADAPVEMLFVGGDWARKGGATLLAAWDRLPDAVRARARLHIVTKTMPSKVADRAAEHPGVMIYRDLTPNSDTLRALYAQSDFFVFPTRGDCLPLAVLEALMSGLPVITTSVGALPEAVQDGETGWVVPTDDAESLAVAMTRLIADPDLRAAMGEKAARTARARFEATQNYTRLIETVKAQAKVSKVRVPTVKEVREAQERAGGV